MKEWMINHGSSVYDFSDKTSAIRAHSNYLYNRTVHMFRYEGLPDTIPHRIFELMIQKRGYIVLPRPELIPDRKPHVFSIDAQLGGILDSDYMPTQVIIANPYLEWNAILEIGKDCIVIPNDSTYTGLSPLFSRAATALTENELSMNISSIMQRIRAIILAENDNDKASGDKYLDDIINGKMTSLMTRAFNEKIKAQTIGESQRSLTELIEYEQYIKASTLNEVGLNANYNMKREAINTSEAQMNDDALITLPEDMLLCRRHGLEAYKELTGIDIKVDFSELWKARQLKQRGGNS